MIDLLEAVLFTVAAVMLLGSPGPGIAALVAIGRDRGFRGGMGFYTGLQLGLALAAAISAAGLFSAIAAIPFAADAMMTVATLYLIWLAWQIARAPVGADDGVAGVSSGFAATGRSGLLLGITNPKAYIAFASLMASYTLIAQSSIGDALIKWTLCVIVMIVVDAAWLWAGAAIGQIRMPPRTERAFNIAMGVTILGCAVLALL